MTVNPREPSAVFDAVYAEHRQPLHAYFFGHTGDDEAAADLLQETFLRAWRNLHTLQTMPASQHRYWLFSVARNLLTDHYRQQSRAAAAEQPLDLDDARLASALPAPDAQVEQAEAVRRVDQAIARLPQQWRTVLAMQVLGEMNSSEIGAALDIPAGTVRYQLSEARRRLAEQLRLVDRADMHIQEGQ